MPTQPSLNLIPTIQQAITSLLMTYEPEFLRFGYALFVAFATILIAWQGIKMMFSHEGLGDQMFDFAKLLVFVSFGFAMIAFYESPLPGIGVSFSNLITDQAGYFQSVLEARAFDNIYRHFDTLSEHFMQPDPWSILANLIYWTVLLAIAGAKAISLAVIAFGLIASAVCGLLGPIFVPFFIVPKLDWLFWGWLRSFIQYLVRAGRGHRVPHDLRAVRLSLYHDAAAHDHAGRIRGLRTAGLRCRGDILSRNPAGAVAHAVDLLRFKRRERVVQ